MIIQPKFLHRCWFWMVSFLITAVAHLTPTDTVIAQGNALEPCHYGIEGRYYKTVDFKNLHKIAPFDSLSFQWQAGSYPIPGQNSLSARWQGRLTPEWSGTYEIAFKGSNQFEALGVSLNVWIDNQLIATESQAGVVSLSFRKSHPITVEMVKNDYHADDMEVTMVWKKAGSFAAYEPVPKSVLLPNRDKGVSHDTDASFKGQSASSYTELLSVDPDDIDSDGLPNSWEIEGMAWDRKTSTLTKWDNAIHHPNPHNRYVKYHTRPNKRSSDNDPYSDADEIYGMVPDVVSKVARHPLVAAAPNIKLIVENIETTAVETITGKQAYGSGTNWNDTMTSSRAFTSGHTYSNALEFSFSDSIFGIKYNTSYTYNSSITHTTATSNSRGGQTSQEFSRAVSSKTDQTATAKITVKLKNTGTDAVYNVEPIFTMSIRDQPALTIANAAETAFDSITPADPPTEARVLAHSGRSTTSGQIFLNESQFKDIRSGQPVSFTLDNENGEVNNVDDPDFVPIKWAAYLTNINASSAVIQYQYENEEIRNYHIFAANDVTEPIGTKLTFGEALQHVLLTYEDSDNFYIDGRLKSRDIFVGDELVTEYYYGGGFPITNDWYIDIGDSEQVRQEVMDQLQTMEDSGQERDILQVKIKPGMVFKIAKLPSTQIQSQVVHAEFSKDLDKVRAYVLSGTHQIESVTASVFLGDNPEAQTIELIALGGTGQFGGQYGWFESDGVFNEQPNFQKDSTLTVTLQNGDTVQQAISFQQIGLRYVPLTIPQNVISFHRSQGNPEWNLNAELSEAYPNAKAWVLQLKERRYSCNSCSNTLNDIRLDTATGSYWGYTSAEYWKFEVRWKVFGGRKSKVLSGYGPLNIPSFNGDSYGLPQDSSDIKVKFLEGMPITTFYADRDYRDRSHKISRSGWDDDYWHQVHTGLGTDRPSSMKIRGSGRTNARHSPIHTSTIVVPRSGDNVWQASQTNFKSFINYQSKNADHHGIDLYVMGYFTNNPTVEKASKFVFLNPNEKHWSITGKHAFETGNFPWDPQLPDATGYIIDIGSARISSDHLKVDVNGAQAWLGTGDTRRNGWDAGSSLLGSPIHSETIFVPAEPGKKLNVSLQTGNWAESRRPLGTHSLSNAKLNFNMIGYFTNDVYAGGALEYKSIEPRRLTRQGNGGETFFVDQYETPSTNPEIWEMDSTGLDDSHRIRGYVLNVFAQGGSNRITLIVNGIHVNLATSATKGGHGSNPIAIKHSGMTVVQVPFPDKEDQTKFSVVARTGEASPQFPIYPIYMFKTDVSFKIDVLGYFYEKTTP